MQIATISHLRCPPRSWRYTVVGAFRSALSLPKHAVNERISADIATGMASLTSAPAQRTLPAAYYRGGTSRGVIFLQSNLPAREEWPDVFRRVLGSPDKYGRQLNGLGVGVSSLSKICIIAPSTREDADIDYTFAAVGITSTEVDFSGNCGNMSAAVGPYAVDEGLVKPTAENEALVRVFNTNTNKLIHSRFPIIDGQAAVAGSCAIAGVSGTGAPIALSFLNPAGAKTGTLLPTGRALDVLDGVQASCVDAANPCVFVRASDLGFDGYALPDRILSDAQLLARLEELRTLGAQAMGMCRPDEAAPRAVPKIAMLAAPKEHTVLGGQVLGEVDVDIVARIMSDRQPHRATPLTAALCLGVAASVKGSLVDIVLGEAKKPRVQQGFVTFGHSSGTIEVSAQVGSTGDIEAATVLRTARRLMDGRVYY